jgi:biotin transport system substrate-specific component|tara:strand:- start:670 stop:1224 length:555 start_codon:yes stop_codon:yes gene_type:complete
MELIKELKQSKIIKNVFVALIGTILLAISSKIKIPFYPVPMTMQTLVVLFLGITLGWKLGVLTVALYLFEGIIGLPVFSGSPEKGVGIVYFTGPTMGYLIGFLFTVYFAGFFKFNKNIFIKFLQLIFSVSFIYIIGIFWLGTLIGWEKPLFQLGVQPFLLAEIFKVLIVLFSLPKLKKLNQYLQ